MNLPYRSVSSRCSRGASGPLPLFGSWRLKAFVLVWHCKAWSQNGMISQNIGGLVQGFVLFKIHDIIKKRSFQLLWGAKKKQVVSSFASAIAFFVPRCTYKHIPRNHVVANLKSWSCCWTWGTRLFTVLDRAPLMKFGCWKCLVFFFSSEKRPWGSRWCTLQKGPVVEEDWRSLKDSWRFELFWTWRVAIQRCTVATFYFIMCKSPSRQLVQSKEHTLLLDCWFFLWPRSHSHRCLKGQRRQKS